MALRTDEIDARQITGTRGASQVLFSPDGKWIAYEASGKLRKSHLDGSSAFNIADANSNNGADWTSRDEIVLGSEGNSHGLVRVSANGGKLIEFLKPDSAKGEKDYLWPIASPDGKHVVFTIWKGILATSMLASASIDGGEVKELGLHGVRPLAIIDRTLVYVQEDGSIVAVKLNRAMSKAETTPVSVLDPVEVQSNLNGNSEIFVSKGGSLLTSRGSTSSKLAWFGQDGSVTAINTEVRGYGAPRLSPDGQTIAVLVDEGGKQSVWLYDLSNKTFSKLPSEVTAGTPQWASNGQRIYFGGVDRSSSFAVFVQAADGGSDPQLLFKLNSPIAGMAVTPDEKSIVVTTYLNNGWRLLTADVGETPNLKPYGNSTANLWAISFSPDAKWLAMVSDEGGRDEVFIRSYPVPSARVQISAGGGEEPTWSRDGSAVYYRTGNALVKATFSKTPTMRVIARDTVARSLNGLLSSNLVPSYEVTPTGRILGRMSDTGAYQLIVVPNWKAELEQKMASAAHK
jgi:Tol biopolymer transport system component